MENLHPFIESWLVNGEGAASDKDSLDRACSRLRSRLRRVWLLHFLFLLIYLFGEIEQELDSLLDPGFS